VRSEKKGIKDKSEERRKELKRGGRSEK